MDGLAAVTRPDDEVVLRYFSATSGGKIHAVETVQRTGYKKRSAICGAIEVWSVECSSEKWEQAPKRACSRCQVALSVRTRRGADS